MIHDEYHYSVRPVREVAPELCFVAPRLCLGVAREIYVLRSWASAKYYQGCFPYKECVRFIVLMTRKASRGSSKTISQLRLESGLRASLYDAERNGLWLQVTG
ncbi:hypothetical protein F2Q70_00020848 [Brassica cretica]|uniref:Uncharacterized protein n=2 Tax=Brassica cretica TaxID=69181 RepID=A0A8S9S4X8_BRACR|nr:hypothetical protein F2Q70_00020848 [Brassica cretica]KAF3587312.1 hypothetical protein F2Q69_00027695 [Brassica cretica]KAF3610870.1 hypothetical protein DY000_02046753 [Brassica cretica]